MLPKIQKVESLATCCWINYDNELLQDVRAEQDVDLTNASILEHIIVALATYRLSVKAFRSPDGQLFFNHARPNHHSI